MIDLRVPFSTFFSLNSVLDGFLSFFPYIITQILSCPVEEKLATLRFFSV